MNHSRRGDPRITNYGWGDQNLSIAVKNILEHVYKSPQTQVQMAGMFEFLIKWSVDQGLVLTDLRDITRDHIMAYGAHLLECIQAEALGVTTCHTYLSAVNQIMAHARGNTDHYVHPVAHARFPRRRRRVRTIAPLIRRTVPTQSDFERLIWLILALQRSLGLRFDESIRIDAIDALAQARTRGLIRLARGTKGGRPRSIHINQNDQMVALEAAAQKQAELSHYCLCPPDLSYAQFRRYAYRVIRDMQRPPHDDRHAYARRIYAK